MSHVTGPATSPSVPLGDARTAYTPAGLGRGVVPLRPLQAGEILDGAITAMRAHPGVMLGLSALVVTLGQAVAIPLDYLYLHFLAGLVNDNTTLGSGTGINDLAMLRPSVLLNALIVSLLVGLLTTAVSRAVLGRPVTLGEVWTLTRPRLPRLVGLSLLIFVVLLGILALGTLPGLLLAVAGSPFAALVLLLGIGGAVTLAVNRWVAWSLAGAALVLEDQPVRRSLKRSSTLVKGGWWRVLGVSLLALLVSEMIAVVLSVVEQVVVGSNLSPVSDNGDGTFAGHHVSLLYVFLGALFSAGIQSVVSPFAASVMALQYVDRRMRREGLDIQMAMNARTPRDSSVAAAGVAASGAAGSAVGGAVAATVGSGPGPANGPTA
ncbi:integral membrane protein [Catenulispora acidiphila DSM 44928]|uniref:Integral membrane protein n=1 Tax=Catenulispora acidiphila (strain DSM 44928 / JCM 14897 / NBRC 102108 / NRRL B-24433 / ID139908) TaxID=479433 RepID=C7QBC8_CATAD|nr:integral membrane protein [Catenulispora acidiphila]ACU76419.1 integral membrane protein [Catenulispora acidiphila DSM 44928]